MDFAEAEKRAIEDAERIKQLGYDREREEAEERARKEAEALSAKVKVKATVVDAGAKVALKPSGNSQDMERLGMGMKRLGFGSVPAAAAAAAVPSSTLRCAHTLYGLESVMLNRRLSARPRRTVLRRLRVTDLVAKRRSRPICSLAATTTSPL